MAVLELVLLCPDCEEPMADHPTDDCWYIDKSDCGYNMRGVPGYDPHGTCSYGCTEEPDCQTGGPWAPYIQRWVL